MTLRVTLPITKYGRYYAEGEIIDDPSSVELSLARMLGWEQGVSPEPAPLRGLRKPELVEVAERRGLDPSGLTKTELLALLEE